MITIPATSATAQAMKKPRRTRPRKYVRRISEARRRWLVGKRVGRVWVGRFRRRRVPGQAYEGLTPSRVTTTHGHPIIKLEDERCPSWCDLWTVVLAPRASNRRGIPMSQTIRMLQAWMASRADDERGATMVEYGLLITLIAIVVAVSATLLGTSVVALYNTVISAV